jgi:hypothetical protein
VFKKILCCKRDASGTTRTVAANISAWSDAFLYCMNTGRLRRTM